MLHIVYFKQYFEILGSYKYLKFNTLGAICTNICTFVAHLLHIHLHICIFAQKIAHLKN